MFLYIPCRELLFSPEAGLYWSTGIRVLGTADDELAEIAFVADISCAELEVTNLALACTSWQLDPVHLRDVIEDFLS